MEYTEFFQRVEETAAFISSKVHVQPKAAIILTAGLEDYADGFVDHVDIGYADAPHFASARAEGHEGKLVFGQRSGLPLVAMQGRFHFYEGHHPLEVVFPYFVLHELGVKILITTNAVGGIRHDLQPGDIVLITDHINMMGMNPLVGIATLKESDQFTDMTEAYDEELVEVVRRAAGMSGIALKEGVFAAVSGPSYETKAEIRALRVLGADAVGMSTVPEVIAARFVGMRVLSLSCVANAAADRHDGKMSHGEVLDAMSAAAPKFVQLLSVVTNELSKLKL
jgi:purine-nucleoside phosphorylase